MILTNPFTGMTLNADVPNPEGCNQHTGPNCGGSSSAPKSYMDRIRDYDNLTKSISGDVVPAEILESEQLQGAIGRWGSVYVHKLTPDVNTVRDESKSLKEREEAARRILQHYRKKNESDRQRVLRAMQKRKG